MFDSEKDQTVKEVYSRFKSELDRLRDNYESIFIDLLPISFLEANYLVSEVDILVVCCREAKTTEAQLIEAIADLKKNTSSETEIVLLLTDSKHVRTMRNDEYYHRSPRLVA
jgi:KaiC/GvpD/RAD55 family RecA-like ATPase